jgi:HPt (histidine-containing phosphotransfer) domain-containing protein
MSINLHDTQFNPSHLLKMVDNDLKILKDVLTLFLSSYQKKIQNIRDQMNLLALDEVAKETHSLRGDLLIFGYQKPIEIATKIEELARNSRPHNLENLVDELHHSMKPLVEYSQNKLKK